MLITIETLHTIYLRLASIQGSASDIVNWNIYLTEFDGSYLYLPPDMRRPGSAEVQQFLAKVESFGKSIARYVQKAHKDKVPTFVKPTSDQLSLLNDELASIMRDSLFIQDLLHTKVKNILNQIVDDYTKAIERIRDEVIKEQQLLLEKIETADNRLNLAKEAKETKDQFEQKSKQLLEDMANAIEHESFYNQIWGHLCNLRRTVIHAENNLSPVIILPHITLLFVESGLAEIISKLKQFNASARLRPEPDTENKIISVAANNDVIKPFKENELGMNALYMILKLLLKVLPAGDSCYAESILSYRYFFNGLFSTNIERDEVRRFLERLKSYEKEFKECSCFDKRTGNLLAMMSFYVPNAIKEMNVIINMIENISKRLSDGPSGILLAAKRLYAIEQINSQIKYCSNYNQSLRKLLDERVRAYAELRRIEHERDMAKGYCKGLREVLERYSKNENHRQNLPSLIVEMNRILQDDTINASKAVEKVLAILDIIVLNFSVKEPPPPVKYVSMFQNRGANPAPLTARPKPAGVTFNA